MHHLPGPAVTTASYTGLYPLLLRESCTNPAHALARREEEFPPRNKLGTLASHTVLSGRLRHAVTWLRPLVLPLVLTELTKLTQVACGTTITEEAYILHL